MKAAVEITIRKLLEADKSVDKKCIDRGIAVLKGTDCSLPEIVPVKEAMKATHMSRSQLYAAAKDGWVARIVTGHDKRRLRTMGFSRESMLRFLEGRAEGPCDRR